MTDKEFGKYSIQQLKVFAGLLHAHPLLQREWKGLVESDPEKLLKFLTTDFNWSEVYTVSFIEQISLLVVAGGLSDWLKTMAAADDPQDAALAELQHQIDTLDDPSAVEPPDGFDPEVLLGIFVALLKNLQSIWHYGMPINNLISQVSSGNDDALFKAVRIDRAVISCSPVADRIAKAELTQEVQFFKLLRNALKGPSQKPMEAYGPLRYILHLLEEEGVLEHMTTTQQFDLLCTELDMYPSKNNDAEKSLDTFIRRWRKTLAT